MYSLLKAETNIPDVIINSTIEPAVNDGGHIVYREHL